MPISRRGCFAVLAVLSVIILTGGVFLYRVVFSRVNVAAVMGKGSATDLQLPPGFRSNVFAGGLNGPRFMALGPDDVIYVADRGNNRIVALPDVTAALVPARFA